jgi:flavin reductase (DIM6/NTAB) family NADH-FMN oxidoreductase RutF
MNVSLPPTFGSTQPSLRDAMRLAAGGVSVITAGIGDERTGLTVTTATSLSIDPPAMLVCINRSASAAPIIRSRRHFCVNILAAHHRPLADRFAGVGGIKGLARYADAHWVTLETGALALDDALAAIDCEVEDYIERNSHAIVIGAVRALRLGRGEPLVHKNGTYGTFTLA